MEFEENNVEIEGNSTRNLKKKPKEFFTQDFLYLISLFFMKINHFELFESIFQVLTFFKSFNPDSDSSCNFTLTLNGKNYEKGQELLIFGVYLKNWPTVRS